MCQTGRKRSDDDRAPAFNYEPSVARLGGDAVLFREMVGFFLEDSPELLAQIRRGLTDGDPKLVERSVHSLKGLAANFDAADTVAIAELVEQFTRRGELEQASQRLPVLERELSRLQGALARFYQDGTPS